MAALDTEVKVKIDIGDMTMDLVREFHQVFGCHIGAGPELPELSPLARRKVEQLAHHMKQASTMAHIFAENHRGTPAGVFFARLQLIQEELYEYATAVLEGKIYRVAHELADLQYVVDGAWLNHGISAFKVPAVMEIHQANMTKLGEDGKPIVNEAGRVVKGPNFKKADLSGMFAETKD